MSRRRKTVVEKVSTGVDTRRVGYARVSTDDQDLRAQIAALRDHGCGDAYIFVDKKSGKDLKRPGLQEALAVVGEGDVLVSWSLDRIGRDLGDLIAVSEYLKDKRAHLICIKDGIDTTTAIGMLYFHIIGAFAQFERSRIAERTSAGLRARMREGVKVGRKKSLTPKQVAAAIAWLRLRIESDGKRGKSAPEIAKRFGVSVVTLRHAVLGATGGEKLWAVGPQAGKRRKRKRFAWTEIDN